MHQNSNVFLLNRFIICLFTFFYQIDPNLCRNFGICRYSSRVRLYRTELAFSALHERGLPLELVEQFALYTQLFLLESYWGILLFFKNNVFG